MRRAILAFSCALVLVCGSYGRITQTFHGSDVLEHVLPGILEVVEKNQGLVRALWGRIPAGLAYRFATAAERDEAEECLGDEPTHEADADGDTGDPQQPDLAIGLTARRDDRSRHVCRSSGWRL